MNTDPELEQLIHLLALEAKYQINESVLGELLAEGTLVELATYEPMVDAGKFDPNVYVVKRGLIRGTYLDKNIEKTAGFALPGTLLISFHSYYGDEPSYYRFEACCPTEVIRIPKAHFDSMLASSHEFALYMISCHQNQLYYNEYKNQVLSGDAKTRLVQLTCRLSGLIDGYTYDDAVLEDVRPDMDHESAVKKELFQRWKEIFRIVPSKIIASYLGITEQHLSKIKKELLRGSGV